MAGTILSLQIIAGILCGLVSSVLGVAGGGINYSYSHFWFWFGYQNRRYS